MDLYRHIFENKNYPIAKSIFEKKYQYDNEDYLGWVSRITDADIDVINLINKGRFLYGGRTLANRGLPFNTSYFNCYSKGYVEDSYLDIKQTDLEIGLTFKAQGGQGVSFSKVRPKGTPVTGGYESDGIMPFIKMFNQTTESTAQGGSRKGALLVSLDGSHKEAMIFIEAKTKEGALEKCNLSLELDDTFMNAVEQYYLNGETVVLHEKRNYAGHEIEYDITPIEIYKKLIETNYDWGEPGCLFVEKLRNYNIMECVPEYDIVTTNPCGK